MVLKVVNSVHNGKIRSKWSWKESTEVHNDKNQVIWSWKESIVYTMVKLGQMDLKEVNWVHNDKIESNSLERSQLGTQ